MLTTLLTILFNLIQLEYWTTSFRPMGIVKIAVKSVDSCGDEDLTRDDRTLLQSFPDPGSLGSEQAEVGCELAASRGQMCSIPYELYDLHGLTEVLSLETWNSCLTEDDRLHLAAYLPDMEQHDFVTTMRELFSGDAMFFGSPLGSFFLGLNGGLYSPQVSRARELLTMLQRRKHYHFLKWYHDGMVGKFASMSSLLRSSGTSAAPGEKVPTSRNWDCEKRLPCVSLSSTTPPISIKDEIAAVSPPMKRAKLTGGPLSTHCSTRHNERAHVARSAGTKNSLESQTFHPLGDPRRNCSELPKGVLKMRTNCASASVVGESEGTRHRPGPVRADQPGAQSSRFCTPPLVFAHDVHGFSENSSSRVNGTSASSQRAAPLQWEDGTLEPYALMGKIPLGVQVQMTVPEEHSAVYPLSMTPRGFYQPTANHTSAYSGEAYHARECAHMKDLLKNFGGRQSIVVHHQSFPGLHAGVRDGHQMNGCSGSRNAESVSEMLSLATRIYPPHNDVSKQLESMRKHHGGVKLEPPPAKPATEAEESRQFAYTYARRKPPHRRPATAEDTTVQLSVLDGMKAKAIKL